MIMRGGRLERFVLIPFSIRCDSESSVALAVSASAAATTTTLSPKHSKTRGIKGGEEKLKMNIKNQTMSKAALISEGLYRLLRRFKSFSQLFVYKEEMEEMEKEMEIGFPTDVKHVTHIGLDGSTTTVNSLPNWENLKATEILSFPSSISLQQFELAMAAQSRAPIEIN